MKKIFAVLVACLLAIGVCFAENYGDIVVYEVPSYMQNQAKNFMRSVSAQDKALYKSYGGLCIVLKSRGYGISTYEYMLQGNYVKHIITQGSYDYSNWNRKL